MKATIGTIKIALASMLVLLACLGAFAPSGAAHADTYFGEDASKFTPYNEKVDGSEIDDVWIAPLGDDPMDYVKDTLIQNVVESTDDAVYLVGVNGNSWIYNRKVYTSNNVEEKTDYTDGGLGGGSVIKFKKEATSDTTGEAVVVYDGLKLSNDTDVALVLHVKCTVGQDGVERFFYAGATSPGSGPIQPRFNNGNRRATTTVEMKIYQSGERVDWDELVTSTATTCTVKNTAKAVNKAYFGLSIGDIDKGAPDSDEHAEEHVRFNKKTVVDNTLIIGAAIPERKPYYHTDNDGNRTPGKILDVSVNDKNSNLYVFKPSHSCSGMSDSRVACVVTGGSTFSRVGYNAGTTLNIFGSANTTQEGWIKVKKVSADETLTNAHPDVYSLEGAKFGVYDTETEAEQDVNRVCTLTSDENGDTTAKKVDLGTYYIKETKASKGFTINETVVSREVTASNTSDNPLVVTIKETPGVGSSSLYVQKESNRPEITDGNSLYSLKGAKFGVFDNGSVADAATLDTAVAGVNNCIAILTTDKDGKTGEVEIDLVTGDTQKFYVKELKASTGYRLNDEVKEVILKSTDTEPHKVEIKEVPKADSVDVSVAKLAAADGEAYDMGGAVFKIEYYNRYVTEAQVKSDSEQPTRTWYVDTEDYSDNLGVGTLRANIDEDSSDPVYTRNGSTRPVVPLGTVAITEVVPPPGFSMGEQEKVIYKVVDDGNQTANSAERDPVANYDPDSDYTVYVENNVLAAAATNAPDKPVKSVDKAIAEVDDTITYTVTQKVIDRPDGQESWHWDSASFTDTLPRYARYVEGSFKVTDTNGGNATSQGALSVSRSDLCDVIDFSFSSSWLASGLDYNGGNLTFTFSALVQDPGHEDGLYSLVNDASTKINSNEFKTNEVTTKVPVWWIDLEKAEHIRGTAWWQGDVPGFSGMVLRARYFGDFTWSFPYSAQAFWESDASGFVNMPENEPSDGEWPYQVDGRNVIPLGTFEWMETQAPQGMAADDTLHRLLIRQVGDEVAVEASDAGVAHPAREAPDVKAGTGAFRHPEAAPGGALAAGATPGRRPLALAVEPVMGLFRDALGDMLDEESLMEAAESFMAAIQPEARRLLLAA